MIQKQQIIGRGLPKQCALPNPFSPVQHAIAMGIPGKNQAATIYGVFEFLTDT